MCTKCDGRHHSILHLDAKKSSIPSRTRSASPALEQLSSSVCNHTSMIDAPKTVLLMTCQLRVIGPNNAETRARALIDPWSSTSFVSEHVVQHLRLPRKSSSISIRGIGGLSCDSARGMTQFRITRVEEGGRVLDMSALILPKITTDVPSSFVAHSEECHHLRHIKLADPEFGVPAKLDLILGADIVDEIMHQGRWRGRAGSPTALKTIFSWVLMGPVPRNGLANGDSTCNVAMEASQ